MMASDASRNIERAIELLPPFYILPIQFIVVFILLVDLINYAMITVVIVVIVTAPMNIFIFLNLSRCTTACMELTDHRVKLVNELLSGIRVVKFYGWETAFQKRITEAREKELQIIKRHAYFMSVGLMTSK